MALRRSLWWSQVTWGKGFVLVTTDSWAKSRFQCHAWEVLVFQNSPKWLWCPASFRNYDSRPEPNKSRHLWTTVHIQGTVHLLKQNTKGLLGASSSCLSQMTKKSHRRSLCFWHPPTCLCSSFPSLTPSFALPTPAPTTVMLPFCTSSWLGPTPLHTQSPKSSSLLLLVGL